MTFDNVAPDAPDITKDSDQPTTSTKEYRRVAMATMVGTTIEWYDFFIYANIAALLFGQLFFSKLGDMAQLVTYATMGISFFFRPAGAVVMGILGDKFGRRIVLVLTLVMMGAATALIGLLPTDAKWGMWPAIVLIILRCIQGFSAGGEWGGAAMLAVEHAPRGQRGKFGSFPQLGVPLGMVMATLFMTVLTIAMPKETFNSIGWRIPFLFSIILVVVGFIIRHSVDESPVFAELAEARAHQEKGGLGALYRNHFKEIILAAGSFLSVNGVGYMIVGGFVLAYATTPVAKGGLGQPKAEVLWWVMGGAISWAVFTYVGAVLSDRIGRTATYKIGYVLMFIWVPIMFLVMKNVGSNVTLLGLAVVVLGIPLGLTYGPQSAMFAEAFPATIRLSGANQAYAVGAVFGGAFAPMIAQAITQSTKDIFNVTWYLLGLTVLSLISVALIKDRSKEPLRTMSGH